ncbi:hypothetical protein Esti_004756 [Eimeria stiedai]
MHINSITLQGFMTYNEPTTIVFSERCTCLIGHNGSGKSNVLLGVAFALGDVGNSASERRMLLHEGLQGRVASGFVELTLNNSQRRLCMVSAFMALPTAATTAAAKAAAAAAIPPSIIAYDSDEVVLRRVFSLTTDDYFVQGKHLSKGEFEQLIECAGLSGGGLRGSRGNSSSSFIIRQGRIQEVALMSAEDRLKLLMAAGGGGFLQAKAEETETILQQADAERLNVKKALGDLKTNIEAMDAEREELNACLALEREKAAIEMALNESTWRETTAALRASEEQQTKHRNAIRRLAAAAAEAEASRDEAATQIATPEAMQQKQKCSRQGRLPCFCLFDSLQLQVQETHLRLENAAAAERAAAQQQRHIKARQQLKEKQQEMQKIPCSLLCFQRTELQRELEAAEAAAAQASAAAEAATETVKQTTKQISSLREPLSDVVERLRQQQGKLSALLQRQISLKAKLQAATDAFWRLLPSDSAWSLSQVETLAEREGWKNANSKSAAGILANFVEVDAEYQRAVEAVGGFCFWHFVVPDSAHALEVVARLKQQQQQQQRGGMGLRPQRRCCLSLLPLKEVAEQQRQRQQLSVRRKQQQQLAQQLLEQGVAMPLVECIRLSEAASAAPETSEELELFLRSVFGSVLLVPSLDSQEVSQWNQIGFDCVNLDGDIAFASGAMRGGGTKGGKLTAYFRMREAQKADEKLTSDLKAQQEALKTLQQEQKKLVEQEQILSEEKLKAQLQAEAHVAAQQKANMAHRAAASLLAVLKEEEEATAARILFAKQLQQTLRRETLHARPATLTSQEKQELQQLQRQQQQQQEELQQLLRRVEETAAALSQAEDAVDVSLRRAVERLEREANEAEGEAWDPEATDRLQAEIESTSKKRQQEEENAAEVESRLRALENEIAAARKSQETAEVSLQSLLQQLDGETALLQQTQHTVDSLKRMQADAASLVAAAAAAAGPTAAAAARVPLAAQNREALHSKLSEIKEKLAEFPHVNRKAVAELATIKDDFAALQRRDSLQEETLGLLQQQVQQLQHRRQQLLQQLLRKVDMEFTSLFSQLVPGGHAKLELVQQDPQSPVVGAEASGLEIRANFRAQANGAEERLSMQRLSGGQKALVALALLLALQRTDVSEGGRGVGLLLLDEADSALDERHRRLLADALKASSQSPGCQVILTTFRPELLDCGDRFLLVQQSQRASRLSEMQKAEAQALLADMPRHLQDEALQLVPGATAAAAVAAAASTPQQQPQPQLLPLQG